MLWTHLCPSLGLEVNVLGPVLCTPLAQAVPGLGDTAGSWQALGQLGVQAEFLGMWASQQQLAEACSVLLWCELGEQVMGKQF